MKNVNVVLLGSVKYPTPKTSTETEKSQKITSDDNYNMSAYALFVYLLTVFAHKWHIIVSGYWINSQLKGTGFRVSWKRLLLHDLSKFTSAELCPYASHFYGETRGKKEDPNFELSWQHHCQHNDHHHEFWVDSKTNTIKPMPEDALMELVADWFAAERAYNGKWPRNGNWVWINKSFQHITSTMHPTTVLFLIGLVSIFGYEKNVMISLHGNEEKKFDWQQALDTVTAENRAQGKRFEVLWNRYKEG